MVFSKVVALGTITLIDTASVVSVISISGIVVSFFSSCLSEVVAGSLYEVVDELPSRSQSERTFISG